MSPEEVNRVLCEKLMKWTACGRCKPYYDIEQAFEALGKSGYRYCIAYTGNGVSCEVWTVGETRHAAISLFSPAAAISVALYRAVKEDS